MLVSTPTHPRDSSMVLSPKYTHRTPPKQSYDSPMFTPSPLRPRPLFPINTNVHGTYDLTSAYNSPALAHSANPFYSTMPQPITVDDEEGSIFLSSHPAAASGSYTPFFATSTSQPLLTPVKQAHRVPVRSPLSPKSSISALGYALPSADLASAARVGVGTKRKSTPHATPLRPNNLTPLKIGSATGFDRLAPLPAPKFIARTPQSKAETDAYVKKQTATLTRLRLSDHTGASDDDFGGAASDSGCEMDEDESAKVLFTHKPRVSAKVGHLPKPLVLQPPAKGKEKEEVAEAISPGGHVTKRRARTRPLSAELIEQSIKYQKSPSKSNIPCRVANNRARHSGPVAFPTSAHRGRASPASSSSEAGSPLPRRRISGGPTLIRPHAGHNPAYPPRPALSRIENVSAATLFFGPSIPVAPPTAQSRNSILPFGPILRQPGLRPNVANRHSYAGPESSGADLHIWKTLQDRSLSPGSSPFPVSSDPRRESVDMDDEEMFFAGEGSSSFVLNVTRNTPSPPAKPALALKYKNRDSLLVSDDEEMLSTGSSIGGEFLMPKASTSVSSIGSEDGLVTPGVAPESFSGWPVVNGADDITHPYGNESVDVDAFIMRTLAAAFKGSNMPKKVPGTPVKKVRKSYFGNDRPWQSAVASKVGLKEDCEFNKKKVPRKSMPAAFPVPVGAKAAKLIHERQKSDTDTEEEDEYSPSTRRVKYVGLGLGLPPPEGASAIPRNRWLKRRSSSGAFSSGGEPSLSSTPMRTKGIDWQLPKPRIPLRLSPSSDTLNKGSSRSTSGSSTSSSVTTLNSPTNRKQAALLTGPGCGPRHLAPISSIGTRRSSVPFTEEEQPGRFERDFVEIEEVGSGEFGKVIKVQSKSGDNDALYAIKKSKRFEGVRHRLRLREEVDILKHLSQAALSQYVDGRHPNVLAYIDSWEEDEALFIRTELCESGNLARFLWEYGRVFPRLDEAQVWKIIVDLSDGLRFIHDSGVIHLDLKPSNVFVTKEGRFKIGDFGMASLWPRNAVNTNSEVGFEREGDKLYLAPEVLQGCYSKAADIFSFGMTILEIASNIVVPDQGDGWQRLRREDFSQVDLEADSPELVELILNMMRTDPGKRPTIVQVCDHPVVQRAREKVELLYDELKREGRSTWGASPLASVASGFLEEILEGAMRM